jgi:hypothetical protein
VTQTPIFGACYYFCKEGDTVAIIYGCQCPLAFCPDEEVSERFRVTGEVYLHDYMHGGTPGKLEERDFELS